MKNKKSQKAKIDIEELKSKSEEYWAGWQRAKADYENLKREMDKKVSEIGDFAKISLLTDLIPIIDNFCKAIEHVPEDQKDKDWVVGVFHIKKQLEDFMAQNGLEKIETVGQPFDHNLHEAVGQEEGEKDIVLKEVSSGYKLNGQVIIPAKVIVGE
jgi:molecular chaperone GrpE